MKKLTLLLIMLFSVGFLYSQENEKLSEKEKVRRQHNIDIGNPFARFGYKPKIATLSKGKYLEFHDRDSIVKIGSFTYNTKQRKITGYTDIDTVRSEATLRPELISRWFSPDPLSSEFPSWSPYNFTNCNPIRFIDPDGRAAEDIIIKGANNSSITLVTDLIDVSVDASSLGLNFGGNYKLQGDDVLSASLDIVGIVDPSGVADGLNASLEAKRGNWFSAGISALGIIPYVGDLPKVGKIGKDVKIIKKAIKAVNGNSKLSKNAQHVYAIINEETKLIEKIGVSGGKISKANKSYRATRQVNKLNRAGGKYTSKIIEKIPAGNKARKKVLEAEKRYSNIYRKTLNPKIHKRP